MQRWWAPQRPTTEPDSVVLAMLEPGDLGAALLATHRAGAAAIETVSKGALPSEAAIVSAMVVARERLAERVIDSVSKAMLSPTYAALLVRDVFDGAEEGALALYRTAVNKGVSPPVAATRAAAVYGVPAHELGKYLQVASDPRSNPVAVLDAADRALMTYVSKLVADEADEKVEFSKAPERPWNENEVRRDSHGRFADEGGTQAQQAPEGHPPMSALDRLRVRLGLRARTEAPARIAEYLAPAKEEAKPVEARPEAREAAEPVRATRAARTARPTRATRTETERAGAQRKTTARRTTTTHRRAATRKATEAERSRIAVRDAEMQRLASSLDKLEERQTKALVPTKPAGAVSDLLGVRYSEMDYAYDLDDSYTVTLDRESAAKILTKMQMQSGNFVRQGTRLFRMGHLLDAAISDGDKSDSPEAGVARGAAAHTAYGGDTAYADVDLVHQKDLEATNEDEATYLQRRQNEKVARTVVEHGVPREVIDHDELQYVHRLPIYTPFGTMMLDSEGRSIMGHEWAIVHFLPTSDKDPEHRPIPTVDEFVVAYGARGVEEGPSPKKMTTILDPNQAYEVVNAPTERPGARVKPQRFWDPELGVVVNRWFLKPVDEDEVDSIVGGSIKKADSAYQSRPEREQPRRGEATRRLNALFEQLHPRDEDGKFTEAVNRRSTVSPSAIPTRAARPVRATRTARAVRTTRTEQASSPVAREGVTRRSQARRTAATRTAHAQRRVEMNRAIQAVIEERIAATPRAKEIPVLDDRSRYQLFTPREFQRLLADVQPEGGVIRVPASMHHVLMASDLLNGSETIEALGENVDSEVRRQEGEPLTTFGEWNRKPVDKGIWNGPEDDFDVARAVDRVFATRPEIAQVYVDYMSSPGYYVLHANAKPVGQQALIEYDDDVDVTRPLVLVPLGVYRSTEMLHRKLLDNDRTELTSVVAGDSDEPVNAVMDTYRLQNAELNRYRVQNDD